MPKGPIRVSPEGVVQPDEYLLRNCGEHALAQLEGIIDELKSMGASFMVAGDLAKRWDVEFKA